MAIVVKPFTFSAGATIIAAEHNSDFDTLYNDYNGNISTVNLAAAAGITSNQLAGSIVDSKLSTISTAGKVQGSALTVLGGIPTGAGAVPPKNGGTGQDFIAGAKGSLIHFSEIGTMTALGLGTAGQVLKSNGASNAPSWTTLSLIVTGGSLLYTADATFTVPSNVNFVLVTIVGAGGGGGGAYNDRGGGGGGAGASCKRIPYVVTSTATVAVVAGTKGTAGQGGTNLTVTSGGDGEASSFGALSVNGGTGGKSGSNALIGAGGAGGVGVAQTQAATSTGGSGSVVSSGGAGANENASAGGGGGVTVENVYAGVGGNGSTVNGTVGSNATGYGNGGGGGKGPGGGGNGSNGGTGSDGFVLVEW